MATFEEQVEGLTSLSIDGSSAPTQTELTQFLTDGASEVINAMPRRLKLLCATEDTFTSAAVGSEPEPLTSGQVLSVIRIDGAGTYQPCREIPSSLRGRASDSDDMNAATTTDPVYYIYNGRVNALPTSGSCKYLEVNKPTVAFGDDSMDDSLTAFPLEYEYLIPLYASMKSLQNAMGNKTSDLPSDITFPSIPVAPSTPSFDTGAISVSSSAPTYTSPVFSAPTLATVGDLTLPVTPTVPTISAQVVADPSNFAPTYTKPVLSLGAAPTISNLTISATSPISPGSPSFTAPDISGIFNPVSSPPSYTEPVLALGATPSISDLTINSVPPSVPTISVASVTITGTLQHHLVIDRALALRPEIQAFRDWIITEASES